jgi:hypothetical protein
MTYTMDNLIEYLKTLKLKDFYQEWIGDENGKIIISVSVKKTVKEELYEDYLKADKESRGLPDETEPCWQNGGAL